MSDHDSTARDFMLMADTLADNGFRLGPKLGEGTYAKVRIVERQEDGCIFAAKIVNRKKTAEDYCKRFLPRELKIMVSLNHPYVIATHAIIQKSHMVFVVMEYAERGDLLHLIRKEGPLPIEGGRIVMRQVAEAINYLHGHDIAHRDLKCENVLIKRDRSIVITDFGFARYVSASMEDKPNEKIKETALDASLSRTFCGSAAYASPELLQGKTYNPLSNDVWSYGCICFIIASGTMPFNDTHPRSVQVKQQKEGPKFPLKIADRVPHECKAFVEYLLNANCTERPTMKDVLKASWIELNKLKDLHFNCNQNGF